MTKHEVIKEIIKLAHDNHLHLFCILEDSKETSVFHECDTCSPKLYYGALKLMKRKCKEYEKDLGDQEKANLN